MKAVRLNFTQMLRQMKHDPMLLAITFTPFLIGILLRFGIPFAEAQLTNYMEMECVISPYYELLDLLLILFTTTMFNLVAVMVVLEEADEHLISYLSVTPLGKTGYLFSRFGLTGIISLVISILVFAMFHLTNINVIMLLGVVVTSAVQGIGTAMLIVTFSANKVEGMAIGKFTSLFTLGALVPFFKNGRVQYVFSVLPSFWLSKAVKQSSVSFLLIAILIVAVWIFLLAKRFTEKLF